MAIAVDVDLVWLQLGVDEELQLRQRHQWVLVPNDHFNREEWELLTLPAFRISEVLLEKFMD